MKRHRLAGLAVFGAASIIACTAAAQSETTIIREHKVVPPPRAAEPAPPPPDTQAATVLEKRKVVHHVVTRTGPARPRPVRVVHRAPPHHPRTTVLSQTAVARVAPPPPPTEPQAPSMVDRKTVIHRNAEGDVTRHTVIEKQDPNGDKTVIEHRSAQPGDEPPPAPPSPGQLRS